MQQVKFWMPSLLWMGLIFYLSSRTGSELGSLFPFLDSFNWGHLVAYFVLALLFYFALNRTIKPKHIYLWAISLSILYGITDEFHQAFVPNRYPDIKDLINDALGASVAMLLVWYRNNSLSKNH